MNKKILKILSLALAAAVTVVGVAGCEEEEHVHDVSDSSWRVITEPTCATTGVEEGICAICGESVYREIAIDEEAHEYGDWDILSYPTEKRMGTAKKICALCGDELTVPLPVLSDSSYTTSVVTRPTATEDGVRSYVYYTKYGNIEFTTTISSTGITSVRDAVEVCCDDTAHSAVRSGTGTVYNGYYVGRDEQTSSSYKFSYEYGENYTHIDNTASDGQERWYGVDSDGEVYGYRSDYGGTVFEETKTTSGAENYIDGYRYVFVWATYIGAYYGTENFVLGLYNSAKQNANGDFEESVTEYTSGDTEYYFTYGTYTINGTSGGYFSTVEVTFTITSEYTIKSLTAECTTYVNTEDSVSWELDENGYAVVTAATGMRYIDRYTVTQKTKTEDPEEPVNPYTAESMRISSYNIVYNDNVDSKGNYVGDGITVDDDTIITIKANTPTQSTYTYRDTDTDVGDGGVVTATVNHFYLTDILPDSMSGNVSDELNFYYREYVGSTYVDYLINYSTGSYTNVGISCRLDSSDNSFLITCNISGYVDIVLKTHSTEKVIHLYVEPIAPSTLYPMLYKYSTSGYSWSSSYQTAVTGTVYAGQNLYFSSEVPTSEARYADAAYTATVTSATGADGSTISSEYYTLTDELTFNGQTMSAFNATKAGTYTIKLVSVRDGEVYSTITVTVDAVPERGDLFNGTYAAKLSYAPKGNVSISFTAGETDNVYYANITTTEGTEVLKCTYDGIALTTEHYSGVESGFSLTFNEAYDLVISHATGYIDDELGIDILETVILTKSS